MDGPIAVPGAANVLTGIAVATTGGNNITTTNCNNNMNTQGNNITTVGNIPTINTNPGNDMSVATHGDNNLMPMPNPIPGALKEQMHQSCAVVNPYGLESSLYMASQFPPVPQNQGTTSRFQKKEAHDASRGMFG